MSRPEIEITAIDAGELLAAWDEIGINKPAKELWPIAVEAGTNKVLIARLGGIAVGSVDIMLNGPIRADKAFREVIDRLYPNQYTAAVYGLYVGEKFRRLGAGAALMRNAEKEVLADDRLANTLSLTVISGNGGALSMYEKLNYRRRDEITHEIPVWDAEADEWKPQEVTSWVMTKELDTDK
jgi:GNAT superfamily N-acetyltransferase